jgi:hypothetical protein
MNVVRLSEVGMVLSRLSNSEQREGVLRGGHLIWVLEMNPREGHFRAP